MANGLIEKRTEPKAEVSHEIEKHDRIFADRAQRESGQIESEIAAHRLSSEDAAKRDFAQAVERLSKMHYATTIDFMQSMPSTVLQLYLLAEEATQNRPEVLRAFPKPGAQARARYLPLSVESPATVSA